jgi:hypothetical protein
MRGVSTPIHQYWLVAETWLQSLSSSADPGIRDAALNLKASTRAYTRVVLRIRAQAEAMATCYATDFHSPTAPTRAHDSGPHPARANPSHNPARSPSPSPSLLSQSHGAHRAAGPTSRTMSFHSPLFRKRRAPLLHVFVPSPEGDWLSDSSVLECEAELRRAGVLHMLRMGDVVWDVAVGDEGNVGRMVWDGCYLIVSGHHLSGADLDCQAIFLGS